MGPLREEKRVGAKKIAYKKKREESLERSRNRNALCCGDSIKGGSGIKKSLWRKRVGQTCSCLKVVEGEGRGAFSDSERFSVV